MQMDGWIEMTFKSSREYPLCLINLIRILSSIIIAPTHIAIYPVVSADDTIHLWINVSSLFFAYI